MRKDISGPHVGKSFKSPLAENVDFMTSKDMQDSYHGLLRPSGGLDSR
jgi:hypothetical protein